MWFKILQSLARDTKCTGEADINSQQIKKKVNKTQRSVLSIPWQDLKKIKTTTTYKGLNVYMCEKYVKGVALLKAVHGNPSICMSGRVCVP